MTTHDCYHCGQPIPAGTDLAVTVAAAPRAMCCLGCQAVAQAIVDNGLDDYYQHRDALPEGPREALPDVLGGLQLYDHDAFQKNFVSTPEPHQREASLILEGITCAACIWLNEQHLSRLPGVLAVHLNYATRRARVRWDERQVKLSEILAAIAAIGYRAHPYDPARNEQLAASERRSALWRVFVAGFGMMQVMMYAFPVYIAGTGDMTPDVELLLRWASLLLTLPVIFYSSAPFFRSAWRDLRLRRVGMDVPVALGVGAAFLASVWATLTASGEVYFDSVTMFVFFLLGGRYLEMTARQKAVSVTEALARLAPHFAQRLTQWPEGGAGGPLQQVVVSDLQPGEAILIRPGEAIAADGVVIEGRGRTDESLLTGESRPVDKAVGASVTGGALNLDSPLVVRVTAVGEDSRLAAIVRLMERASTEKPRIVELADRIASRFVLALLCVAALVALVWWVIDPARALWITVSVLVVTCPCALSLAMPVSLTVATGALARQGMLVTRGHAIETLARATHFVFDKTGTLTTGRMSLAEVHPFAGETRESALAWAAALEQVSEHPLARALCNAAAGLALPVCRDVVNVPGQGLEGLAPDGRRLRLGRPEFVQALHGQPMPVLGGTAVQTSGTLIALGDAAGWRAWYCLDDVLRPEAATLIASLQSAGCTVSLLTGDARAVAERIAATLGIRHIEADATPQGKHDYVSRLQQQGAVVAMVGDGVNDAPVLAQAQVSVAMGGGSQLARTQADLVLLSERLDHLQAGIGIARRSLEIIRQNLWWSFAYNFIALPLAMVGWITPWMAGVGMSGSSLLVVMNALRLQHKEK